MRGKTAGTCPTYAHSDANGSRDRSRRPLALDSQHGEQGCFIHAHECEDAAGDRVAKAVYRRWLKHRKSRARSSSTAKVKDKATGPTTLPLAATHSGSSSTTRPARSLISLATPPASSSPWSRSPTTSPAVPAVGERDEHDREQSGRRQREVVRGRVQRRRVVRPALH